MSVIVPGANIGVRNYIGQLVPLLLSIGAGLVTSPAFTFVTFIGTTRGNLVLQGGEEARVRLDTHSGSP